MLYGVVQHNHSLFRAEPALWTQKEYFHACSHWSFWENSFKKQYVINSLTK